MRVFLLFLLASLLLLAQEEDFQLHIDHDPEEALVTFWWISREKYEYHVQTLEDKEWRTLGVFTVEPEGFKTEFNIIYGYTGGGDKVTVLQREFFLRVLVYPKGFSGEN